MIPAPHQLGLDSRGTADTLTNQVFELERGLVSEIPVSDISSAADVCIDLEKPPKLFKQARLISLVKIWGRCFSKISSIVPPSNLSL